MDNINLSALLFAARNGKEVSFKTPDHDFSFTVGDRLGPSCHARICPPDKFAQQVTITPIITAADNLAHGLARVWEAKSSEQVYCEISKDENIIPVIFDGKGFSFRSQDEGNSLSPEDKLTVILSWLLSGHTACEEVRDGLFGTILKLTAEPAPGEQVLNFISTCLARLCDAVYYGYAVSVKELTQTDDLALDTVRQALGSGELEEIEALGGIDFAASPLAEADKVEIPTAAKKSAPKKPIIKRCLDGEFRRDWGIDQDYSYLVPHGILEWFVPTPEFERALPVLSRRLDRIKERMEADPDASLERIIGKVPLNFALYGPPGSGKTLMAEALAEALGLPLLIQSGFTASVDETIFQYQTIPDEDGRIVSVPSTFLQAFQMPCIFLAEEMNLLKPDVAMGALGEAIWAPFQMSLYGHKTVSRHPLSVFMFTQNIGTYGSKDVNQALIDRIGAGYKIAAPSQAQVISVLMQHIANKPLCEWVYKAYSAIAMFLDDQDAPEVKLACSLNRTCGALLEEIADGVPPKTALIDVLVSKIELADRTGLLGQRVADDIVKKTIVDYKGKI